MKLHKVLAVVCMLGLVSVAAALAAEDTTSGQTEAHHHMITGHHQNALHHAKALHHHAKTAKPMDKEVAKEHAEEIGKSLDAADKHTAKVEEKMTEAHKTATAADLKGMKEEHAKAHEAHAALNEELSKENPEPAKVAEHAAKVHQHVTKAAKHHAAIKKAEGVKEPVAPPSK